MSTQLRPAGTISPQPQFASILRQPETFGTGQAVNTADRVNSWFDTLMLQSGLGISPSIILFLSLISAVAIGGLVFVIQENLLSAALATLIGFMIPVAIVMFLRSQRQRKILAQMPTMLEELARAAKTGRSLEQCLQFVTVDTPAPLGTEMQTASRRIQMGLPVKDAFADLADRTGVNSLNLFTMSLAIHQLTGGDLVTVLERLSRTIRDRLSFEGRLRAATAASRATAILMVLLPPAIIVFFVMRDPLYLEKLFSSGWGRNITLTAVALEAIGSIWIFRILKASQMR